MRWDEVRRAYMIWDEMKCGVWSAKCEVGDVKSTVWSLKKRFTWRCIVMWLCAGHFLGQQHGNRFAQSTHGRVWLAHGACKFYRWKGSYSIFLRQLSPRLVRVLLVYLYPDLCLYRFLSICLFIRTHKYMYFNKYLYIYTHTYIPGTESISYVYMYIVIYIYIIDIYIYLG